MSPEPLRREPGPRDWSPTTGFSSPPPPTCPPPAARWQWAEPNRSGARPFSSASDRRAPWVALLASFLILFIAFVPQRGPLGLVGSIALGLVVTVGAFQARKLYRLGRTRFVAPSTAAVMLSTIATGSLVIALISGLMSTPLPHLAVATELAQSRSWSIPAPPPAAFSPALPAAPAAPVELTAPTVEPLLSVTFASAADEQRHLIQELGTVQYLIATHHPGAPPESIQVSPTGFTHATPEGAIMMAKPTGIDGWYMVLPNDAGYVMQLTGTQYGTRATFDSTTGQITLG